MTEHKEELEVTWREGKLSNFTVVGCGVVAGDTSAAFCADDQISRRVARGHTAGKDFWRSGDLKFGIKVGMSRPVERHYTKRRF